MVADGKIPTSLELESWKKIIRRCRQKLTDDKVNRAMKAMEESIPEMLLRGREELVFLMRRGREATRLYFTRKVNRAIWTHIGSAMGYRK